MERDTLRLFAKCCRKAKQSEKRWPRLSRTRFHRSHHTSLPFISVYSAIAARAYYTPRLASRLYFSYALYSLFVLLNARDQSFPFLLYHVLFLTAEVPPVSLPLCPPHLLRLPYVFDLIYPQPPAIPPCSLLYIYRARAPSLLLYDSVIFPRRSFVTTLLSLLILIDTTSRARVCPRQPSSPSFFIPHYPPGCITSARLYASQPRSPFSPSPAAFISFR